MRYILDASVALKWVLDEPDVDRAAATLPARSVAAPAFGRISPNDACYATYRKELRRTTDEPFALFVNSDSA